MGGRKKKQRLGSISMAMSNMNSNTEFMTGTTTSFAQKSTSNIRQSSEKVPDTSILE